MDMDVRYQLGRQGKSLLLALAMCVMGSTVPAAAAASTTSVNAGVLTYTADSGESNQNVHVYLGTGSHAGYYRVSEDDEQVSVGSGCEQIGEGHARCATAESRRYGSRWTTAATARL